MHMNPKRPAAAFLSAVMLLGMFSPPAQALNTGSTADPDPAAAQSLGDHPIQTLPELDHDGSPEAENTPDRIDWLPLVPATPTAPVETIPALKLTPAQKAEQSEAPAEPEEEELPEIQLFARDEVYTSATASNHVHSGDGTYANPYNLFDDAVKNAMPGGTIIIKNKGFLNTLNETGSLPYIIDKELTIKSEDPNSPASLQVRAGGIVLGADLTIENVNLNFENRVHDAFFANGHTLTLKNVLRANGSREVDLFGGQLYEKSTNRAYAVDKKGSNSQIIIEMDDPKLAQYSSIHFGNIYAGSMNGSFDGSTNVQIKSSTYKGNNFIGAVYASGADETPAGNMLDIVEPDPPKANSKYTTSGDVTFDFDNLPLRFVESDSKKVMLIDGNTGSSSKTNLTVSVPSPTGNLSLKNISALTVKKGAIQPSELTETPDSITIEAGAELDLSSDELAVNKETEKKFTTGTLSGNGILTLKKDASLTVENSFNDSTLTFQTEGAWNGKSGMVEPDKAYITVPSNSTGSFNFFPHFAQKGWTFTKNQDKWTTKSSGTASNIYIVRDLHISPEHTQVSMHQNSVLGAELPFIITLDENSPSNDIAFLPFDITVTTPSSASHKLSASPDDPSTYKNDQIPFELVVDQITEYKNPDGNNQEKANYKLVVDPKQTMELGTYEIELSYTNPVDSIMDGSKMTTKGYLTCIEAPAPQASNSQITITAFPSSPTFGEPIDITAQIQRAASLFSAAAEPIEKNKAYLFVNGKRIQSPSDITDSTIQFKNIATSIDNNFHRGENQISVVYGGGDKIPSLGDLNASFGSISLTINKVAPNITVHENPPSISKTYDSQPVIYDPKITVTAEGQPISKPEFKVIYKKDQSVLEQPPVLPGTYATEIQVAEGENYAKATVAGPQIIINKAIPKVTLSHSFSKNDKIVLQATVQGVESGIVPTGTVSFTVDTTEQSTKPEVQYGTAKLEIQKPSAGLHNIKATYLASTDSKTIYDDTNASATSQLDIAADHKPLTGITLNQQTLVLKKDGTANLNVTFEPQDASNKALTWVSTNNAIATVNDQGQVTAKAVGTTTIEARAAEGGYMASCVVTVSETDVAVSSVEINVPDPIMQVGETSQLFAIIKPSNATARDVKWQSNSDHVTVEPTTGKITANSKGSAQITATVGGKSKTCTIEVTDNIPIKEIKLNTLKLSLKANQNVQLIANILPDNATSKEITWKSDSNDVTVDSDGWITSSKVGATANITAVSKDQTITSDICVVTVIAGDSTTIPVDSITISPDNSSLNIGDKRQLTATVLPVDATNPKVRWESQHENIVTIDEHTGVVTAKSAGKATITATSLDGSQKTVSTTVTVNAAIPTPPPTPDISIAPNNLPLKVDQTGTLTATLNHGDPNNIVWSIENNSNIIEMTPASDKLSASITAKATGEATVKVTYTDGTSRASKTATATVTVTEAPPTPPTPPTVNPTIKITPKKLSLKVDETGMFTAAVENGDSSNHIQWTIENDTQVVRLDTSTPGKIIALTPGTAVIKATYTSQSGVSVHDTATVEVSAKTPPTVPVTSVSINETGLSLKKGQTGKFTATVLPSEATNPAVTWSSDHSDIASVDPKTGVVTAHKNGQATIKVTSDENNQLTDSRTVTVIDIPVTEVKIIEAPLSLREGRGAQLVVRVSPSDATDPSVKWESDDTDVLRVDRDGYVTAERRGSATITVTSVAHPELKDSRTISVTRSSSGGSSGGSSHKPSKPDNKPKPEATKPEPPKPTVPTPQIPQTVKPEPPKPGTPVIASAPPVNPTLNTTFTDIPTTHWASEPIKDVVSRGLFVGTEKGNFSPDESMTRAMVVTVLHRLAGEPMVQSANQFTDVGRTYYTDAVTWANQNHIVSGTSANTFAPNLMVTREELVVMLYRVANPVAGSSADLTRFADSGKVSSWASTPMQWAVQTGILKGSDGALLPQNKLSRAEAASLISRFTEQFLTQ